MIRIEFKAKTCNLLEIERCYIIRNRTKWQDDILIIDTCIQQHGLKLCGTKTD